jgi:hypothetical protein
MPVTVLEAFLAGITLSFLNGIIAIFFIKKAFRKKKHTEFSDLFFKSLGIRAILVLIIFVLIVKFTNVDVITFSITFIAGYVLFIFLEIVFINNFLLKKQGN